MIVVDHPVRRLVAKRPTMMGLKPRDRMDAAETAAGAGETQLDPAQFRAAGYMESLDTVTVMIRTVIHDTSFMNGS